VLALEAFKKSGDVSDAQAQDVSNRLLKAEKQFFQLWLHQGSTGKLHQGATATSFELALNHLDASFKLVETVVNTHKRIERLWQKRHEQNQRLRASKASQAYQKRKEQENKAKQNSAKQNSAQENKAKQVVGEVQKEPAGQQEQGVQEEQADHAKEDAELELQAQRLNSVTRKVRIQAASLWFVEEQSLDIRVTKCGARLDRAELLLKIGEDENREDALVDGGKDALVDIVIGDGAAARAVPTPRENGAAAAANGDAVAVTAANGHDNGAEGVNISGTNISGTSRKDSIGTLSTNLISKKSNGVNTEYKKWLKAQMKSLLDDALQLQEDLHGPLRGQEQADKQQQQQQHRDQPVPMPLQLKTNLDSRLGVCRQLLSPMVEGSPEYVSGRSWAEKAENDEKVFDELLIANDHLRSQKLINLRRQQFSQRSTGSGHRDAVSAVAFYLNAAESVLQQTNSGQQQSSSEHRCAQAGSLVRKAENVHKAGAYKPMQKDVEQHQDLMRELQKERETLEEADRWNVRDNPDRSVYHELYLPKYLPTALRAQLWGQLLNADIAVANGALIDVRLQLAHLRGLRARYQTAKKVYQQVVVNRWLVRTSNSNSSTTLEVKLLSPQQVNEIEKIITEANSTLQEASWPLGARFDKFRADMERVRTCAAGVDDMDTRSVEDWNQM
jgi:hypothetical protein